MEEEYREARTRGMPVLLFLEEGVEREPRQQQFVDEASSFVTGYYRVTFQHPDELAQSVAQAIRRLDLNEPDHSQEAAAKVEVRLGGRLLLEGDRAAVAVAFHSIRIEEIIDPRDLESNSANEILRLGHQPEIELFDYGIGYERESAGDLVRVVPVAQGLREGNGIVAVELTESGSVYAEASAVGVRGHGGRSDWTGLVVQEEDLELQLGRIFRFSRALYEELDPYGRHHSFVYNAALFNVGYHRLERNFRPRGSIQMGMHANDRIIAHEAPRRISRPGLASPTDEIERTILRFRQRVNS